MSRVFLIDSVQRIKENTVIDNNVDEKLIKAALYNAQNCVVEPVLGGKLYNFLLDGIDNSNLANAYQNLIVKYVWDVLIWYTIGKIALATTYKMSNAGVVSSSNSVNENPDFATINSIRKEYRETASYYRDRLIRHLENNTDLYPEYSNSTDAEDVDPSDTPDNIDFYFDGDLDDLDDENYRFSEYYEKDRNRCF